MQKKNGHSLLSLSNSDNNSAIQQFRCRKIYVKKFGSHSHTHSLTGIFFSLTGISLSHLLVSIYLSQLYIFLSLSLTIISLSLSLKHTLYISHFCLWLYWPVTIYGFWNKCVMKLISSLFPCYISRIILWIRMSARR